MKEEAVTEERVTFCPAGNSPQIGEESTKIYSCKNCLLYFTNPRPIRDFFIENYSLGGYYKIFQPDKNWEGMWKMFPSPFFVLSSKKQKLEAFIPPISYGNQFKENPLIHFSPQSLRRVVKLHGFELKELTIDNISLNPGKIKNFKYFMRNLLAKHLGLYTHQALFLCAQKI
jgi:hypothetical protein